MNGNNVRVHAVTALSEPCKLEPKFDFLGDPATELFGTNVFSLKIMKTCLPKAVFGSLKDTVETGRPLDEGIADVVAAAMKDWAISKGATHFTHVFYPLTGLTAEKHDSFLMPDGEGGAISEFTGKALIQGEPDASSFPSGGIRTTFEARGYTAWDVTSPAYIMENYNGSTLCIPTVFIAWTGEALDKKTPLLRSIQALDRQARRVLKLFGHDTVSMVMSFAGCEQEYFLIDRKFYNNRPDLVLAGRSLFGAPSPKGQELDDHYFGAINDRVQGFMMDVDRELFKLGIPSRTRHNEVAPGQFEIAPLYEPANLAADHQQLTMTILKKVAERNGFACLLHEKPFAGVNGSGKHLNFSIGNQSQGNLFDPGQTPHENAQFLVFCAAMIRAVHLNAHLMRAVVASSGNDHRLGANEAPPAIISIFLGEELTNIFNGIVNKERKSARENGIINVGVDTLPAIPRDSGDRNRTSPFAFTGNRFEFRAVGSNQSVNGPLAALNIILADSLEYIADAIENETRGSQKNFNAAIRKILKEIMEKHGAVIFNGDGYTEMWQKEAAKRGLPNLRTAVDALPALTDNDVVSMFEKHKVLSRAELQSREEVYFEQYCLSVNVEANLTAKIGKTVIFPAAIRYQGELARTCADLKAVGYTFDTNTLDKVTILVKELQDSIAALEDAIAGKNTSPAAVQAKYFLDDVVPAVGNVRRAADALEEIVADDMWPLPKYYEMLFIK
ncbi:MAG: glutamine synthetase III [Syntrophales bacterium]|nr:glutamine synthetase III [Syntrophales bacterium]MDY0045027.1 glutamine synthetase III [Syntrophales bacterium]